VIEAQLAHSVRDKPWPRIQPHRVHRAAPGHASAVGRLSRRVADEYRERPAQREAGRSQVEQPQGVAERSKAPRQRGPTASK
jgi:hypothetical protein